MFAVAEQAAAVLLFDEADTLFGKRTQISDAHDRYANVEVGYLLQKIEEYTGIAVLATNLHSNIDPAFARRMHFAVEFPFPDERSRADIWKVTIPDTAPVTDDLAFDLLARRFPVAGGSIRNMAVAAAILAAAEGQPISVAHVAHAARREYQKLGKMPPDASFFGQGQAS